MNTALYETYVQILHEELVPAMGCTEPIAVAYAGALARQTLGTLPERIELTVSGNIIKNVKSVIVPHTGGRKGLPVAVAAGVRVGDADAQLEVLANVTEKQLPLLDEYLSAAEITVSKSPLRCPFDIQVRVFAGGDTAFVQIVGSHTNVVRIEKNGEVLLNKPFSEEAAQPPESRRSLTVEDIIAFADEVDLDDVRAPIARQIEYNTAIAEAGLTGQYGAAIGKILLDSYGDSVQNRAKAWAAAGSDARMNGCEKPVVINSGSGNQGMTASLPVIVYARELKASEEQLYRALVVSNLVTIHLKTGIGSLSAYCGATSAGAGAGAGICYLYGGRYDEIAHTVVNALAINSGMLCDGAKASCAAKIASAVEAGLLGMQMYRHDSQFYGGDGIYWVGQVQRSYGELSGSLGWPFYEVAGRYDPNYDLIYDIFVWFVGLFTKDTGTVFNLYVLVIPFANALAGYAVFRMVGLRRWLSFAFGLTFGLTPYVQQRMAGHMMLAACEFVPFSVLLCLWCAEDEQFNRPGRGFFKNKRNWLALAMAWGIANNGAAYYPYFTCFFLCVTALCLILRDRRWRAGTSCVVTIAEIVAWMIPDFFPMVLGILNGQGSTLTNGVYRSPVGADIYSLRISSLLLSPNGFGLQKLANWMGRYFHVLATDEGPMYNENAYGYLGIVGIFGFLALLLMLLRSRDWKAGRTERPELEDRLWLLSRLNVMALLLATIAGFGGIIGIFVRFIRGYNRISPYIAFFALLAVGLALEKQLTRRTGRSRKALAAVAILLLGYGYWEQQGFFRPAYEEIQDKWYQDEAFMNEVEAAAGDGAMLFTLPYMKNFENGSLNNMWDYTLLRGPLHSKTLKFTYGAGYGTKNDLWYRETSELEPDAMVAELRTQGMTGIYLDLDGYPEDEQQSALAALTEAAGCGPEDVIHSGSGLLCYIPLGQE